MNAPLLPNTAGLIAKMVLPDVKFAEVTLHGPKLNNGWMTVTGPRTSTVFPRSLLAEQGLPALKERLERDYIVHHFRRLAGDTDALACFLGLRRRQLYRRCERLKLRLRDVRPQAKS